MRSQKAPGLCPWNHFFVIREEAGEKMRNHNGDSITIMVVDDYPDIVFMTKKFLEGRGYTVKEASSGEKCLELLEDIRPDLILLDIMMSGLNGWEVCRRIKNDYRTYFIPVLMISSKSCEEDVRRSLEAGAIDHLTKPIKLKELLSNIEHALEMSEFSRGKIEVSAKPD